MYSVNVTDSEPRRFTPRDAAMWGIPINSNFMDSTAPMVQNQERSVFSPIGA
jgi:hypothetical protein